VKKEQSLAQRGNSLKGNERNMNKKSIFAD